MFINTQYPFLTRGWPKMNVILWTILALLASLSTEIHSVFLTPLTAAMASYSTTGTPSSTFPWMAIPMTSWSPLLLPSTLDWPTTYMPLHIIPWMGWHSCNHPCGSTNIPFVSNECEEEEPATLLIISWLQECWCCLFQPGWDSKCGSMLSTAALTLLMYMNTKYGSGHTKQQPQNCIRIWTLFPKHISSAVKEQTTCAGVACMNYCRMKPTTT
jgi:hypothetical protein